MCVVCLLLVRRYAIAVLAMALWPSVCPSPSQAGIVSKRLNASSSFSGVEATYGYPALCFKGIPVSPKITVLHSGSLSQTLDLEKNSPRPMDRRPSPVHYTERSPLCTTSLRCVARVRLRPRQLRLILVTLVWLVFFDYQLLFNSALFTVLH